MGGETVTLFAGMEFPTAKSNFLSPFPSPLGSFFLLVFSPPANYKIEQDRFERLTWPFVSPRIFFTFQFMRRMIEKENNRQRVYFWNRRVNHETLSPNKIALRLNRAFPRSLRSDYTSLSYLPNLQRTLLAFLSILSFEERRASERFIARNTPFKFMLKSILSRNGTIPKHDFSFIRVRLLNVRATIESLSTFWKLYTAHDATYIYLWSLHEKNIDFVDLNSKFCW